ncbi:MAG: glycosyltransferase [Litorilituus sp.]|jgi:glycosyltransferase involved in cell wall biosynthesis|nr:glycosyltransferase [Litorilituus sp.]
MKKLLIIGYVWPEPNSSAAGSRMIQLIKSFQQQQYQITFASPAQRTEHMVNLIDYYVDCVDIKLNCHSFDNFITQLQPELVVFDRFMMEEQFGWRVSESCPQALKVLDTEDFFTLRHARHRAFKQQRQLTDVDLLSSDLAQREVAAIFRCDLSLMISLVEIELLTRLFKVDAALLHYCPFMIADKQLAQMNPNYEQRDDFISIGNFRHSPNWDAVLWLKEQIWPLIRKQLPQAKLNIYGAYPPPKATNLHDENTGFFIKGWVDDAIVAMQSSRVCVAPLRFGAGIKGKLAEAMLCATPSVTTDIGAEGMMVSQSWPGIVANTPQAFADGAVKLYKERDIWQKTSDLGPHNAKLLFEQHQHFAALAERVTTISATLVQHRQQNFIGSMLNHHHHKSTKYMAQWIEAKNKL